MQPCQTSALKQSPKSEACRIRCMKSIPENLDNRLVLLFLNSDRVPLSSLLVLCLYLLDKVFQVSGVLPISSSPGGTLSTYILFLDPLGLWQVLVEDGLLEGDSVSESSVI